MKKIFYIIMIVGPLGGLCTDIAQPSMPFIQNYFDSTLTQIQFSMTLYLLGYMLSQILYGLIADKNGNKKPLIIGLFITIIGTIGCVFANNIEQFSIYRLIQGLGIGSTTLCRSIVAINYKGPDLQQVISFLGSGSVLILALAPLVGSYLQHHINWQSCFYFTLAYLIIAIFLVRQIKENTLIKKSSKSNIMENYKFWCYATLQAICYANIMAWIIAAPFILQHYMHFSVTECGYALLAGGLSYTIASFIYGKINCIIDMRISFLILILNSITLLYNASDITPFILLTHIIIMIITNATIFPQSMARALEACNFSIAGAALGVYQIFGGFIVSFIIAISSINQVVELGIIYTTSTTLALILLKIQHNQY